MPEDTSLPHQFDWRTLSNLLGRISSGDLLDWVQRTAPPSCLKPASFFARNGESGAPFWLPVNFGDGLLLPFVLSWDSAASDEVLLEGPETERHPFWREHNDLWNFVREDLGLRGTWRLRAAGPTKETVDGHSWKLPLYYAARALAVGLRTRLDVALTGDLTQALQPAAVEGVAQKSRAARELGLSTLALPSRAEPRDPLFFLVRDIGDLDTLYEGYLGPDTPPGGDPRSRAQRESDVWAGGQLARLTQSLKWPGKMPPLASGLVEPRLRELEASTPNLVEKEADKSPATLSWHDCVQEIADIARDCDLRGRPLQVALDSDSWPFGLAVYFRLRAEDPERDVIFADGEESLRWARDRAFPLSVGRPLRGTTGLTFTLKGAEAGEAPIVGTRLFEISRDTGPQDPFHGDAWGRQLLTRRAERARGWLRGTRPGRGIGNFVGRGWLDEEVKAWALDPEASSVLYLQAPPGWGKTSYVAHLARAHASWAKAVYFCDAAHDNAHDFARSVVAQISRWDETVERAMCDESLVQECKNPQDYLTKLLLNPCEKSGITHIVLVDSLHEAREIRQLLVSLLNSGQTRGLRFLVTGTVTGGMDGPGVQKVALTLTDERNEADLEAFVLARLSQGPGQVAEESPHRTAREIAQKADGLFAYAEVVAEGILRDPESLSSISALPKGLHNLFEKHFAGNDWLRLHWDSKGDSPGLRDLFGLLCVAPASPTRPLLQQWLGDGVTELGRWVAQSAPFVREAEGGIAFFHGTAKEWFIESTENAPQAVDPLRSHRRIAEAGMRFGNERGGASLPWSGHFIALRDGVATQEDAPLLDYYLRFLPRHLLESHAQGAREAKWVKAACDLLTNFDFQMLRCGVDGEGAAWAVDDLSKLLRVKNLDRLLGPYKVTELRHWLAFFRTSAHILRRGCPRWPSHKIFLQLAVEHADDSPVTNSAEEWLRRNPCPCDWLWLRNPRRPIHVTSACVMVYEGHKSVVRGAIVLPKGRMLSWSDDATVRLWTKDGREESVWADHAGPVEGVVLLAGKKFLSWSRDGIILRSIEANDRTIPKFTDERHSGFCNVVVLPGGAILAKSFDGRYHSWSQDGAPTLICNNPEQELTLEGENATSNKVLLSSGAIVSWACLDNKLILDLKAEGPSKVLDGHDDVIHGAIPLVDGGFVSWSADGTLRLWSGTGDPVGIIGEHSDWVVGVCPMSSSEILSWSNDGTLCVWSLDVVRSLKNPAPQGRYHIRAVHLLPHGEVLCSGWPSLLISHNGDVLRVLNGGRCHVAPDGRILSFSENGMLHLWSEGGDLIAESQHKGDKLYFDAQFLSDGRILSWSGDSAIRTWSQLLEPMNQAYNCSSLPNGGWCRAPILGVAPLSDGCLLMWSWHKKLSLWSSQLEQLAVVGSCAEHIRGALPLNDKRILSWTTGGMLLLWTIGKSAPQELTEHRCAVDHALNLPGGQFVTWADGRDGRICTWAPNGALLRAEQCGYCVDGMRSLGNGTTLSWYGAERLFVWDLSANQEPKSISADDAPFVVPDVLSLRDGYMHGWVMWTRTRTANLRNPSLPNSSIVSWHSRHFIECHGMYEDGTLVVTAARSTVMMLQLCKGGRRARFSPEQEPM